MKRFALKLWLPVLLFAAACMRESPADSISLVAIHPDGGSRSLPAFESAVNEVCFAVYGTDGKLIQASYTAGAAMQMKILSGRPARVYAIANLGNVSGTLPALESGLELWGCEIRDLSVMPMCGSCSIRGSENRIDVPLRRLMAKISLSVDAGALSGGSGTQVLGAPELRVRQAAKRLYPFMDGGSRALSEADIAVPDEATPGASAWVVYVPENVQGALLPSNGSPSLKVPESIGEGRASLCTYLQLDARKQGSDGVSGGIGYRFYLGADNVSDFSVRGGSHYSVSLELSWQNLFLEGCWKVRRSDNWTDRRSISLTGPGQLPAGDSALYSVEFSRDGTALFSVRDSCYRYPYGWNLGIGGEELPIGVRSGETGGGIIWQEAAAGLAIRAPDSPSCIGRSIRLEAFSFDRIKSSAIEVQFIPPSLEIHPAALQWYHSEYGESAARSVTLQSNLSGPGELIGIGADNPELRLERDGPLSLRLWWNSANYSDAPRIGHIIFSLPAGVQKTLTLSQLGRTAILPEDPEDGGGGTIEY